MKHAAMRLATWIAAILLFGPGAAAQGNPDAAILASATAKYESGDHIAALREMEPLYERNWNSVPLVHLSARCLARADALAGSRDAYLRLITVFPENALYYRERAVVAARMGDAKRAGADLAIAKSIDPASLDLQVASRDVETALRKAPAPLGEAEGLRLTRELYDRALQGETDQQLRAFAAEIIARSNVNRLRYDEAYRDRLRELRNAALANPNQAARHAELADFLYSEAVAIQRVSFRPATSESLAKELAAASTATETALKLDPQNSRALFCKSAILMRQARLTEALPVLENAVEKDPANDRAKLLLAELLYRSSNGWRSQAALLITRRLVRTERIGNEEISYYEDPTPEMLAKAQQCEKLAAEQKARADAWRSSTQKGPEDRAAPRKVHTTAAPLLEAAWMYLEANRLPEAGKSLEEAANSDPADARVAAYFGAIAQMNFKGGEALAWYRAALALEEIRLAGQGLLPALRWSRDRPGEMMLYLACNQQLAQLCMSAQPAEAQDAQRRLDAENKRLETFHGSSPVVGNVLPGGVGRGGYSRRGLNSAPPPERQTDDVPRKIDPRQDPPSRSARPRGTTYDPNKDSEK